MLLSWHIHTVSVSYIVLFVCYIETWPGLDFTDIISKVLIEGRAEWKSTWEIYDHQCCGNMRWKTFGCVVMMWERVTLLTVLERLNAQTPPRIARDHFLLTSNAWAQLFYKKTTAKSSRQKVPGLFCCALHKFKTASPLSCNVASHGGEVVCTCPPG